MAKKKPIGRPSNALDPDSYQGRVGGAIRKARTEKRMTLQDLASLADLSVSTLSDYENGKVDQSITSLRAIARSLGMTICELLPGERGINPRGD